MKFDPSIEDEVIQRHIRFLVLTTGGLTRLIA